MMMTKVCSVLRHFAHTSPNFYKGSDMLKFGLILDIKLNEEMYLTLD